MNHNNTITTTNHLSRGAGRWPILVLFALSNLLVAHGGFVHVIGTVVKVENNVLTVKTAKGDVDVKLSEKTEITKADKKAQLGDLKAGTRVVADVPEGGGDKAAHSIKIGTSGAAVGR